MEKNVAVWGHLGLLLGLLGVILELNQIAIEMAAVAGTGQSAFYTAVLVWLVGIVLVALEWFMDRGRPGPQSTNAV